MSAAGPATSGGSRSVSGTLHRMTTPVANRSLPMHECINPVPLGERLDPPEAPCLPYGSVPVGQAKDHTEVDPETLFAWIAANDLPGDRYVRAGGVWLFANSLHDTLFLVLDYFACFDPEQKHSVLLNHEAGRCFHAHPLAYEPALDRRQAQVRTLPPESLAGSFTPTSRFAGSYNRRHLPTWVLALIDA